MFTLNFLSAVAAATLLSMASAQTTTATGEPSSTVWSIGRPSQTLSAKTPVNLGCFNSSAPLEDHGAFKDFQARGNCQLVCIWLNKPVMALSEGDHCWCGDMIPANNTLIDDSHCDIPCPGFPKETCGGAKKLYVMLTGTQLSRPDYFQPPEKVSSSVSSSIASSKSPQNVVQTSPPASSDNSGGGSNKTAIAVGAVVGIVALLAIIGGVFFFLRQRRRREVEEEFRRQANINSFTAGGKLHTSNSSVADSRLDPEFMNRRQSNGSIADNEDYSRRILKVTNA